MHKKVTNILYPEFLKGSILKSIELQAIRDNIWDFINNYYKDNCDGIVRGVEVSTTEKNIIISKGILKHKNYIYWTKEDICFDIPKKEGSYYIYFNLEIKKDEFLGIFTIEETENKNCIEIARFHLRDKSILQDYYSNLFIGDILKYNTINLEYSKISNNICDEDMIHPSIIKEFCNKMKEKKELNKVDVSILSICLHSDYKIGTFILKKYIKNRLNRIVDKKTEILLCLGEILKEDDENFEYEYFN